MLLSLRVKLERLPVDLCQEIVITFCISVDPLARCNKDTGDSVFRPACLGPDNTIGEIGTPNTHFHLLTFDCTVDPSPYTARGQQIYIFEYLLFIFCRISIAATLATARKVWMGQIALFLDPTPLQDLF